MSDLENLIYRLMGEYELQEKTADPTGPAEIGHSVFWNDVKTICIEVERLREQLAKARKGLRRINSMDDVHCMASTIGSGDLWI
jgi:hypothetical protein